MAVIGYARVSTAEQNLDLQLTALQAAGAARTFADKGVSGSAVERPQLSKALDRLETGDVLTVWKLDRLGANTRYVLQKPADGATDWSDPAGGAMRTTVPMTPPLSSSSWACAASSNANRAATTGLILRASSSSYRVAQASINGRRSSRQDVVP